MSVNWLKAVETYGQGLDVELDYAIVEGFECGEGRIFAGILVVSGWQIVGLEIDFGYVRCIIMLFTLARRMSDNEMIDDGKQQRRVKGS